MPLSYCHTCHVGTAGVHLGVESPMPEYFAGWLETKRGSNVICKHMHTFSLKTVRCEVVFTHLVCPTPRVVADMKRQVGILQVCQPLCTQFLTFFRLCPIRELKKAFVAPIFVMTLSLLIETAESFALRHSYLSTYASWHHMCSSGYHADYVIRHTFSGFFRERVRQNGGALVAKIDATFGFFLINLIHCSPL